MRERETALEIFGAPTSCAQGELLWTSPVASTAWETFCATLIPTQETPYLTLTLATSASAALFVDHVVPVPSCP